MSQPSAERHFKLVFAKPPEPSPGGVRGILTSLKAFMRGSTANHVHLRERLLFLWGSTIVIDLICSLFAYWLECRKPGSGLHNYGDSLFWTTTQLLTISSQLPNPVTAAGKVLDVVMEFLGITIITAQAGSLGSFLYRHSMERNPPHHLIEGVANVSMSAPESGEPARGES